MPKHSYLMLNHFQIPSILKVGAKRYFGQSALGGPFHVTLWVYLVVKSIIKGIFTWGPRTQKISQYTVYIHRNGKAEFSATLL